MAGAGGASLIRSVNHDAPSDPNLAIRRDGYLFVITSGTFSSEVLRISLDGSEAPARIVFDGKFRGLIDSDHVLNARNLELARVFRISDGEIVKSEYLAAGFAIPNVVEAPSGFADGLYVWRRSTGTWPDLREYLTLEVRDPLTFEIIEERVWPDPIGSGEMRVVARSGSVILVENYSELRAIDLSKDEPIWSHRIWNSSLENLGSYTVKDGLVFCTEVDFSGDGLSRGGEVTLLDLESGRHLARFDLFDTGVAQETMNYRRFAGLMQPVATASGWWVPSGRNLLHLHKSPRRPRMAPVVLTMRDNEIREIAQPMMEKGSGLLDVVISEKRPETYLWPLAHGGLILDGMGEGGLLDGEWRSPIGVLNELDSSRSAFAYLAEPGWPIGLLGGFEFQLSPHRERGYGQLLDPQAPTRKTTAVSLAYHRDLLAVAYPWEDAGISDGRRGLVDIYDVRRGKFLRSFSAPRAVDKDFGTTIAFAGDGLLCIGAPGAGLVSESRGAVHVYEASSGRSLGQLLLPGICHRFGRTLAGSDEYIAVASMQGNAPNINTALVAQSVTLYQVDGLRWKFTKTFNGEAFGSSLALSKDRLLVGSTLASVGEHISSGVVRVFELSFGWEQKTVVPVFPRSYGYFGKYIAANKSRVIVGLDQNKEFDIDGFVQWDGSAQKAEYYHGMPGGSGYGAISLLDDVKLQGHAPLRLYRGSSLRPFASYDLSPEPFNTSASSSPVVVSDGKNIYWARERVYKLPLRSLVGVDGRSDQVITSDDWIFDRIGSQDRGGLLTIKNEIDDGVMGLRLSRVENPQWGSVLESSPDLREWSTVLSWSRSRNGWIGLDGQFYPADSSGGLDFEVPFDQSCHFFRVRLRLEP